MSTYTCPFCNEPYDGVLELGHKCENLAPTCQVMQRIEKWPYVKACKELATHTILPVFRGVEAGGIERICAEHSEDFKRAYGSEALTPFEYKISESGDSVSIEPDSQGSDGLPPETNTND